jgi:hypothetical protein
MVALIIYALIGFLLANGLPHLVAGAGGQIFRSPFGRYSRPKINLAWGLANFLTAIVLLTWRLTLDKAAPGQIIALFVGVALGYAMFGFAANRFFDDRKEAAK